MVPGLRAFCIVHYGRAVPGTPEVTADAHRTVDYDVPLDVVATVAGVRSSPSDPTSERHGDTYWKARHTSAGPATVAVRQGGPRSVNFWAWGRGAHEALTDVHRWLGLDDPLESFDPSLHPVVAEVARSRRGVRLGAFGDVFERLVPTILGQLVVAAEAKRSYARLVHRYGTAAPGPQDLRLSPSPDTWRELAGHHFHQAGVERKRAEIIQRVAKEATRLDRLVSVPVDDAYRFMTHIRGIGPWTAASVGRMSFGDPDSVITGDYNLPHTVAWALAGKRRSDDEEMLDLLAPFAGHRGRVQGMLKGHGKPPRHGPKYAFREVEKH